MKKIQVMIEGETPLLMNSPAGMLEADPAKLKRRNKLKERDYEKEAEKVVYRDSKTRELYIPATAVKGCLINATSWKKFGKYALKPIMAAAARIEPFQIGLGVKDYEVDLRTVVIQRSRVVKARPKLNKWKASFTIVYNENMIGDPNNKIQCLEEAGERIGLLDVRPQKGGEFGCFRVSKWLPKK